MYTTSQYAKDLKAMIEADKSHLRAAVERGDRTEAHRFVDVVIDNQRELEDLKRIA